MDEADKHFYRGIIVAASYIAKDYDQPTMAKNLLWEYNITKDFADKVGIDDYDVECLKECWREEEVE